MRRLALAIVGLFVTFSSLAQNPDPVLIENSWFLIEISVGSETYDVLEFQKQPLLSFGAFNSQFEMYIDGTVNSGCLFPDVIFMENPGQFEIPEVPTACLDEPPCGTTEPSPCFEIHGYHYNFYGDFSTQAFGYELIDNGDTTYTLITVNSNGDVARYDSFRTLSVDPFERLQVTAIPNPATNMLYISLENLQIETVAVYDVSGKQVLNEKLNQSSIDVSGLNTGMYFLEVSSGDVTVIQKFIKK